MSRSETEYLRHILDEANYLAEASEKVTWEAFSKDETLKRAFVRSIEVIGEATKNLSEDLCARNPDVPWRAMAGMGDRLIHGYFGVDYEIVWKGATVWKVATRKAPELIERVSIILQNEDAA